MLGGLAVLVTAIGIGSAAVAAVMAFVLGTALLPGVEPLVLMLVWDGVIALFLMLWLTGLLIQLQLGGESLSLDKLLHMPVSPSSAFFVNFLGSQLRVSLVVFLGVMFGLAAASVAVLGVAHLVLFPLVLGLAALVTCVTHQFQSWLGRLFAKKRRRGTVVAVAVLAFVALVNLPALLKQSLLDSDVSWGMEQIGQWVLVANALFPPGWLALGALGRGRRRGLDQWPGYGRDVRDRHPEPSAFLSQDAGRNRPRRPHRANACRCRGQDDTRQGCCWTARVLARCAGSCHDAGPREDVRADHALRSRSVPCGGMGRAASLDAGATGQDGPLEPTSF